MIGRSDDGAPQSALARIYARWIDLVVARPRWASVLITLALIPTVVLTVRFFSDIRAGLQELLPNSDPSVVALSKIHDRLGGKSHLTIIAQSPDRDANRRFITTVCERLAARHLPETRSIQCSVKADRDWVLDHGALLLPDEKFNSVMDELEDAVAKAKAKANPFYVDLGGSDDEDDKAAWKRIEARLDDASSSNDRFPEGYIESKDGHIVVGVVWLEGSDVEVGVANHLLDAAKAEAAAVRPDFPANLRVAWNGEVPNLVEEHDAILADLSLSSLLVFALVGGLIAIYFRSLRAVIAVGFGLVPGLLLAFALGRIALGHLNSNTAFLGSIIAGNGINYPLLLLAYYRQRSPEEPMGRAILVAARSALPGTIAAAATASAAYGGLAASSFKGFSQFGLLGGVGMFTIWLATFIAMPIAIALLKPPRHGERTSAGQAQVLSFFSRGGLPMGIALGFIVVTVLVGAVGARMASKSGLYEMDLMVLRNRDSLRAGSASWDAKMNEVFGVWLNPVVALVEDPADRKATAAELRRVLATGENAVAERVETIDQYVLPKAQQEARLARLRKVEGPLAEVKREDIPKSARRFLDAWFAPDNLKTYSDAAVPHALKQAFTEVTGQTDRVVLIYPSLRINYNDGRNVLGFASRLSEAKLPAGTVVGGSFLFMAAIIKLVHDEGPLVVLVVCLLVGLVLVPIFRRQPLRIPFVVLTIAAVAVAAQAVMLVLGVRLNMLNFAAVPITIGVGADYLVNLLGAMDAFSVDARRACARMGGAILLCSLTTIVGYVSLVIAQSGALRTFGWAAVLGEFMAVITVLVVIPGLTRRREDVLEQPDVSVEAA